MTYVLLDHTNTVVNVIVYDGTSEYVPPAGLTLRQAPDGTSIGMAWDGTAFVAES